MTRVARSVACVLLAFGFLVTPAIAQERSTRSCELLDSLPSVPQTDRGFLGGLCRLGQEGEDRVETWAAAHPDEQQRLMELVRTLVEADRLNASALAVALPGNAFTKVKHNLNCDPKTLDKTLMRITTAIEDSRERADDPKARRPYANSGNLGCDEILPVATESESRPKSTEGGLVAWTMLAPPKAKVRLLLGGRRGGAFLVEEAQAQKKDYPKSSTGFAPYTAMLPYGVPYVAVVDYIAVPNDGSDVEPEDPAFVLQGVIGQDGGIRIGLPQMAVCADVRVASEKTLRVFLDGAEVDLRPLVEGDLSIGLDGTKGSYGANVKRLGRTLWIPESPESKQVNEREHRLVILEEQPGGEHVIRATRDLVFQENQSECLSVQYDLSREQLEKSIGLGQVGIGECAAAGIDEHKVRFAVMEFLRRAKLGVADIAQDTKANQLLTSLNHSSEELGESSTPPWARRRERRFGYGADRGELDTRRLLAGYSEELVRQGFSSILDVDLHCSRHGNEWDYSFQARRINLQNLADQNADPLLGKDLSGVVKAEIEFILERDELALGVNGALSRLFTKPGIGLKPMAENQEFVSKLKGEVVVQIPPAAKEQYYVDLSYVPISEETAVSRCADVSKRQELRAKSGDLIDQKGAWILGPIFAAKSTTGEQTLLLHLQPVRPAFALVRARLLRATGPTDKYVSGRTFASEGKFDTVREDYRCTNMSPAWVEGWATLDGWLDLSPSEDREETMTGVFGSIGIDWNQDGCSHVPTTWKWKFPCIKLGFGLGYGYTERKGSLLPVWDGLSDPDVDFDQSGKSPYIIREHAILAVADINMRGTFCEATGWFTRGKTCTQAGRRFLLMAQVRLLPGFHIADLSDPSLDGLTLFRGDKTQLLADVGLLMGLGAGIELRQGLRVLATYSFGWKRLGDYARDPSTASTYQQFITSPNLGVAWDF